MYLIKSGLYEVSFDRGNDSGKSKKRYLQQGDHFGEIGLVYGCKRTANVESKNYGQIGKLTQSTY